MPGDDRGIYVLVIELRSELNIKVGKLGMTPLSPGKYLYVGRAKRYLSGRLRRHLRKDKIRFWHIDYLLQEAYLEDIWTKYGSIDECQTAATILSLCPGASFPAQGFGSSDCRCPSHLIQIPRYKGVLPRLQKAIKFVKADIHGNQG